MISFKSLILNSCILDGQRNIKSFGITKDEGHNCVGFSTYLKQHGNNNSDPMSFIVDDSHGFNKYDIIKSFLNNRQ